MAMPGLIAIVGRPNVGKSALFNRIVGKRIAIVHDEPGVTRDRIAAEAEWRGRAFTLIDTGGIGFLEREKAKDPLAQAALEQVELAIEAADGIVLVVNVQEGVVPLDREVAQRLRVSGKPVWLAVNKVDNFRAEEEATEFRQLGFEKIFPVSAIHGLGVGALLDVATSILPAAVPATIGADSDGTAKPVAAGPTKLAILGRPNVGKSSLVNALTRSQRVVVTPIPGTTRDAVDVPFEVETEGVRRSYVLIDTAGLRKQRRVDNSIEFFSTKRTEDSIARCDIAILVLDAETGLAEQDKKIAGKIIEERKACIVLVNKWDLVSGELRRAQSKPKPKPATKGKQGAKRPPEGLAEFAQWVQANLFFLDYAPVLFVSAKTGYSLDRLLEAVRFVEGQLQQEIPTSLLNRTLHLAVERRQPVSIAGHRLKFFYAAQVRQAPPTFLLFVNRRELFTPQYEKYLADELRQAFGFEGCPLVLVPKSRPKTIESKRGHRKQADRDEPKKSRPHADGHG